MSESARGKAVANDGVLRMEASLDQLAALREFIRHAAAKAGADPAAVPDIVQAVDELVTNSIVHGYRGQLGTVEVEVDRAGKSLVVRLRDKAPVFDPTSHPTPDVDLPLSQRSRGGMGVFLARELMDTVKYRRTKDGNELTLTKECITQPGGGHVEDQR